MGSPAQTMLTVTVKYGKETLLIEAEAGWKVQNLMEAIQKVTNVHPRGQKLIHKGKLSSAYNPS